MSDPQEPVKRTVEPFDEEAVEERLREILLRRSPRARVDDLELRHLIRVITECSMILTDVYSDPIGAIGAALLGGHVGSSRDALAKVLAAADPETAATAMASDVSAAVVTRTNPLPPGMV